MRTIFQFLLESCLHWSHFLLTFSLTPPIFCHSAVHWGNLHCQPGSLWDAEHARNPSICRENVQTCRAESGFLVLRDGASTSQATVAHWSDLRNAAFENCSSVKGLLHFANSNIPFQHASGIHNLCLYIFTNLICLPKFFEEWLMLVWLLCWSTQKLILYFGQHTNMMDEQI